jgi:hypothetical protein
VAQMPLWLHRPVKRFIQYWGVVLASIPPALLYLGFSNIAPNIAFALSLPLALVTAFLTWRWLERKIQFRQRPIVFTFNQPALVTDNTGGFSIAAGSMVVVLFVVGSQSSNVSTYPTERGNQSRNAVTILELSNATKT